MTPKARAQEALEAINAFLLAPNDCFCAVAFPRKDIILEALALLAALEKFRFGWELSFKEYRSDGEEYYFLAHTLKLPLSGYGPTPTAAILAAVEKTEKKS